MSLSCTGGGLLFVPLHGKTNRIAYGQTHNRGTAADRAGAADAIRVYSTFFADFDADKASSMVDFFGLPTDRRLGEMSKGMGEKLQISLVMSRRARVFLLDEPISGVDPATRDVILDGILREFDPASLLIMSTHLISDIEHFVDYALFMKDGQVFLQGDADDLRASHGDSLDAIFRKEYR